MTERFGHDISEFQSPNAPTGNFEIVKLTEGAAYVNPEAKAQIVSALSSGQQIGGYHFAHPGNPVEQAKLFVSQFPAYRPFIPFLDIEAASASPANDPVGFSFTFLNEVESLTHLVGGLYINESVYRQFNWSPLQKEGFLLWIADWNSVLPTNAWKATLWQNSDGGGKLDADIFFGDANTWKRLGTVKAAPKPKPKPKPKPAPIYYVIQHNDTLDGIAAKFHTSVPALVKLNRTIISNPNIIFADQKIRVR